MPPLVPEPLAAGDLSANFSGNLAFFRIDASISCSISISWLRPTAKLMTVGSSNFVSLLVAVDSFCTM